MSVLWLGVILVSFLSGNTGLEYNFVVEEFITDFHNPNHRLSGLELNYPESNIKVAHLVNRQYPGPTIEAYEGEEIVVHVHNHLSVDTLSLHWHGLFQKGTPWMDGSDFTQFPITPMSNFTYRFIANPSGTKWWHSHSVFQLQLGVAGSLIIKKRNDPYASLYSEETNLLLTDWFRDVRKQMIGFPGFWQNGPLNAWQIGLINGQWGDGSPEYPYPILNITTGKCSRIRIVSIAHSFVAFQVKIVGHNMTLISEDGSDIEPMEIGGVTVAVAGRADVIICANQPVGNYLINITTSHTEGFPIVENQVYASFYAYLHYSTAGPVPNHLMGSGGGVSPSPSSSLIYDHVYSPFATKSIEPNPVSLKETPDEEIRINLGGFISFEKGFPSFALYLSPNIETTPTMMGDTPLLFSKGRCGTGHMPIVTNTKRGSVLQIIVDNLSDSMHPLHLHGYRFSVIGLETNEEIGIPPLAAPLNLTNCDLAYGAELPPGMEFLSSRIWGCRYNATRDRPKLRLDRSASVLDTVMIPPRRWVVLRLVVDNPGWWMMHCHLVHHSGMGMMMAFNHLPDEQLPIPNEIPKYGYCANQFSSPTCPICPPSSGSTVNLNFANLFGK